MTPITVQNALDAALQYLHAGRLQQAEQLYRQVLAIQPDHAVATHYRGVIALQAGRSDIAADLIRRAIAIDPLYAAAHNNLGTALKETGQIDQAIDSFRRALALNPDYPAALINLGDTLQSRGLYEEAIVRCRGAIALNPNLAEAYSCLGNALGGSGQLDDAIDAYQRAIALSPGFFKAHNNLGNALRQKGRLDEAIAAYQRALNLNSNSPETHGNLGDALKDKGLLDPAIVSYRQALALRPNHADIHYKLGLVLREMGLFDDAIAAFREVTALRPESAEAQNNLGAALVGRGDLDDAIDAFRKAITLSPHLHEAHRNLAIALRDSGRLDEVIAAHRAAAAAGTEPTDAQDNLLYPLYFHPAYDARAIAEEHRQWARRHAEPLKPYITAHGNDRNPDRRLRVGYVSPDFREHPVGRFLLPLLENHDSRSVEVFAYANSTDADTVTDRLHNHTDCWRDIACLSDAQTAELIRQDGIDILVDLTLHMAKNRMLLFARKPAPVQVTYLAYAGTSGLGTMDYRLSDPYLDPVDSAYGDDESIYSEQTVRLAETYWCYQPVVDLPLLPPPSLTNGCITFGCLNNFCKVNEPLLRLWARLLSAVPRSRLILHAKQGSHRRRVLDYLQGEGVEPSRVSFAGTVPTAGYFASYHSIDIALDTAPYGGGTTTCDALWMGVPVASLAGKTAVGRSGYSILSNVGLPELVAGTDEQYVRIAACLAGDVPRLTELRSTLRRRMEASPLMDGPRFARSVEAAFRWMWRFWCQS